MNFGNWDSSVHDNEEQLKRIEKARTSDCTPDYIDHEQKTGTFQGSGKVPYETTLDSCTCGDYRRRKLPCKHIYRLAIEIGALQADASAGLNKNTINRFLFSMPAESQALLYHMCYDVKSGQTRHILIKCTDIILPLIEHGFCIECMDMFHMAAEQTVVANLKELLRYANFDGTPKMTSQKKTFVKWLMEFEKEHLTQLQSAFSQIELTKECADLSATIVRRYQKRFNRTMEEDVYGFIHEALEEVFYVE